MIKDKKRIIFQRIPLNHEIFVKAAVHSCLGILVNISGRIPFMKSIYSQRISRNVDIPSTGTRAGALG